MRPETQYARSGDIYIGYQVAGRDLVAGSELRFAECGAYALKGVLGEWRLYRADCAPRQGGYTP